jgi:hypothetical protein
MDNSSDKILPFPSRSKEDRELENFIYEWHEDSQSYLFAKALGKYLFEFMNHLRKQKMSERALRKHIDNCWSIGYLECGYGYHDDFAPDEVFGYEKPSFEFEFRRKFRDSDYAVKSFRATWTKIHSYTKSLGHTE